MPGVEPAIFPRSVKVLRIVLRSKDAVLYKCLLKKIKINVSFIHSNVEMGNEKSPEAKEMSSVNVIAHLSLAS